jgi:hypothetical protein
MKKSIGKPCEGKLHARFDEGGADCFIIFVMNNSKAIRLYSTVSCKRNCPTFLEAYLQSR